MTSLTYPLNICLFLLDNLDFFFNYILTAPPPSTGALGHMPSPSRRHCILACSSTGQPRPQALFYIKVGIDRHSLCAHVLTIHQCLDCGLFPYINSFSAQALPPPRLSYMRRPRLCVALYFEIYTKYTRKAWIQAKSQGLASFVAVLCLPHIL